MFYIGSEVIVIGSNIKRKSGPRKGSIGNVSQIQNPVRISDTQSVIPSIISFSRYGHENKSRLEIKTVYINSFSNIKNTHGSDINFEKCINKFIQQTSKIKLNPSSVVVLAPIGVFNLLNIKKDNKRIISYIISVIKNPIVFTELNNIVHSASDKYSVLKDALGLNQLAIIQTIVNANHNDLIYILNSCVSNHKPFIKNLLNILNNIKSLILKNNRNDVKKPRFLTPHLTGNILLRYMFMEHKYASIEDDNKKNIDHLKQVVLKKGRLEYKAY